jgi:hypothetical protein
MWSARFMQIGQIAHSVKDGCVFFYKCAAAYDYNMRESYG